MEIRTLIPIDWLKLHNGFQTMQIFKLRSDFTQHLQQRPYHFGYAGLGATVYYRSYSRANPDGTREHWPDTVIRVAEGTLSARKQHMLKHHLHWDDESQHDFTEKMFTAMHDMHWLPPGRGLWSMGTEHVERAGGMALNNCAFVSTAEKPQQCSEDGSPLVFAVGWTMQALMRGAGVGFNCDFKENLLVPGKQDLEEFHWNWSHDNTHLQETMVIPDSREGWVDSVKRLLMCFTDGLTDVKFDYSLIRPQGSPIKGFGGTASGPEPLMKLHRRIRAFCICRLLVQNGSRSVDAICGMIRALEQDYYDNDPSMTSEKFQELIRKVMKMKNKIYGTTRLVVDIFNAVGACVVAGNVRRSSEIALSAPDDLEFLDLKNLAVNPERAPLMWMSNNTVQLTNSDQFTDALPGIVDRVRFNGEPGIFNMLNVREFGRVGKVHRQGEPWTREFEQDKATGSNPCITGDSIILTARGRIPVHQLVGKQFEALLDHEICPSTSEGFWSNGVKDIVKITLVDGSSIKATPNHRFMTDRGWVEVRHLSPRDKLKVIGQTCTYVDIETIVPFGQAEVFDCSIPGSNCYYANDLLSHNCGEIPQESTELCNLAEVFPDRCRDSDGKFSEQMFMNAIEYATYYASTVSLVPTHSAETNSIIAKNRRIGISISGVVPMLAELGELRLVKLLRKGYTLVRKINKQLAQQAGVVESIRVTTIKPSGSISQLVGVTSGIHPATEGRYVIRRVRETANSDLAKYLIGIGVPHVMDEDSDNTAIFEFPLDQGPGPTAKDVSVADQLALARLFQRNWADNSVSISVYFDPKTEGPRLGALLASYLPDLKSVSLFPRWVQDRELVLKNGAVIKVSAEMDTEEVNRLVEVIHDMVEPELLEQFNQQAPFPYKNPPYQAITLERYQTLKSEFPKINWSHFAGGDVEQPRGCDGDRCIL